MSSMERPSGEAGDRSNTAEGSTSSGSGSWEEVTFWSWADRYHRAAEEPLIGADLDEAAGRCPGRPGRFSRAPTGRRSVERNVRIKGIQPTPYLSGLLGENDGQLHRGGERPRAADLPGSSYESGTKPQTEARGGIVESVRQTIKGFFTQLLEKAAVVAAHCLAPGAGHLVVLIFEGKELLGDAEALVSSDGPVQLHIPLLHLPPGVELEAGVQLGADGEQDGPGLFIFVAPGNGGLLGGWALEREKDDQGTEKPAQAKPAEAAVIGADLSPLLDASRESQELAASLRETAARLQSQLSQVDDYRGKSVVAVYRGQADLDPWVAVVDKDPQTGRLTLRFLA